MEGHLQQAAKDGGTHARNARDWLRIEDALAYDPQAAATLGHQHAAVGKESEAPRMRQAGNHRYHANRLFRSKEGLRQLRQWRPGARGLAADGGDGQQRYQADNPGSRFVHEAFCDSSSLGGSSDPPLRSNPPESVGAVFRPALTFPAVRTRPPWCPTAS